MVEQIKSMNLNEKVQQDFLVYANAVIVNRAIPSAEDNLKPVHRRILYAMNELKLTPDKKTMKCAKVVGDVMGKYHPHGDASIYDALIHLAQPWKMRYPLVEVEGNMGNIIGDSYAASRYTECRLSPFGALMLKGIGADIVPFKPTYDETSTEPVILPGAFPNILCNGNLGIAVGLSTNLVPHNLTNANAAIQAFIGNRDISIDELTNIIVGPDFPTGGIIIDGEKLKDIYKFGSGAITLRGKYKIETVGGKQVIVFTEIPYLVNITEGVINPLKKLVNEEGFDLIENLVDLTNMDGVNIRIILKKGANVNKVLEELWKNTRLQITQKIGNTVIVNGVPKVFNIKEMIRYYVEHQNNIILSMFKNELKKINKNINIANGLVITLDKLDLAISIIRESEDRNDAENKLMRAFALNKEQVNAVLDMKLSKLTKLDAEELKRDLHEFELDKEYHEKVITTSSMRDDIILTTLYEITKKYGDTRRTQILSTSDAAPLTLSKDPVNVLFMRSGKVYMTTSKLKDIDFGKKGSSLNESQVAASITSAVSDSILIFTKSGKIYNQKLATLNLDELQPLIEGEDIVSVDKHQETKNNIVFITSAGVVKRTPASEYENIKTSTIGLKLREADELLYAAVCADEDEVHILGKSGKLVKFKVSDITATGKLTIGSKGIDDEAISAVIAAPGTKIFSINNDNQAKLCDEYSITAKGGTGQVVAEGTKYLSAKSYVFINDGKKTSFVDVSNLSVKGKTAVGAKLTNGTIIGIAN